MTSDRPADARVLYVDPAPDRRERVASTLADAGFAVETADGDGALDGLDAVDCVVSGLDPAGIDLLSRVRDRRPDLPVVVSPPDGSEAAATAALRAGATDYVPDGESLADRLRAVLADADRVSRRRERKLRRYEQVLQAVRGMVYALDAEGRFTLVTDPLADLLGYDRSELVGRHASVALDDSVIDAGRRTIERLLEDDRENAAFETELTTAEGDRVPVEVEVSLLPPEDGEFQGTVGVIYDRSELAAIRERLERERHRFTYLFETLPDPVTESEFVDGEPVLRSVNASFRETFCPDVDEVVGHSVNEFVLPPDDEAESEGRRIDQQILEGESVTAEVRRETAAGPRDFLFRGVPYLGPDHEDGPRAFGIYTDITEQKRYERRLEVLHRVLRHNLRNRTTAIEGYARRIATAVEDPELNQAVERLRENTDALDGLNEKAQAIERAASPTAGGEGPVDVADLARTIAEGYDDRTDVALETDLPGECVVAADDRLATAVENLVENAVEHGSDDDATDDPWVRLMIDAEEWGDDWVTLRVVDNGPGIPDHERAVVNGERDITQLEHGSGLGLWLVRWVVEAVGGGIEIENRDGGGTVVSLRLRRPD